MVKLYIGKLQVHVADVCGIPSQILHNITLKFRSEQTIPMLVIIHLSINIYLCKQQQTYLYTCIVLTQQTRMIYIV